MKSRRFSFATTLAAATCRAFQAIEEVASGRLQQFANAWDSSAQIEGRLAAINSFIVDCFQIKKPSENEAPDLADLVMA
jgi:hypothetical protein